MPIKHELLSAPINVDLMITRQCNLRCVHCSASSEQFSRGDMSTAEIISVIDQLAACQVFRVCLTGGEPLLHKDFFALADRVMSYPMRLQINTNATLIDKAIVNGLTSLKRRPFISVSLDGISEETHDRIRGKGSFAKVLKGIELLLEANLRVRPFVVVSAINHHEIPAIIRLARTLSIKEVFLTFPVICGRVLCYEKEMHIDPDIYRRSFESVLQSALEFPGLLRGPCVDMAREYEKLKKGMKIDVKNKHGVYLNCGGGERSAAIACDGTVSPCQMAWRLSAGNVRDDKFENIWRDSDVFKSVRNARNVCLKNVTGCETCSWHHECNGPCPATGFNTTGMWPASGAPCFRDVVNVYEERKNNIPVGIGG